MHTMNLEWSSNTDRHGWSVDVAMDNSLSQSLFGDDRLYVVMAGEQSNDWGIYLIPKDRKSKSASNKKKPNYVKSPLADDKG